MSNDKRKLWERGVRRAHATIRVGIRGVDATLRLDDDRPRPVLDAEFRVRAPRRIEARLSVERPSTWNDTWNDRPLDTDQAWPIRLSGARRRRLAPGIDNRRQRREGAACVVAQFGSEPTETSGESDMGSARHRNRRGCGPLDQRAAGSPVSRVHVPEFCERDHEYD